MNDAELTCRRLLMPVDGSASSLKAARFGLRLARRETIAVLALHVVDEENAEDLAQYADRPLEQILGRMERAGEGYLAEVRTIAQRLGVKLQDEVRVGIPHRVILERARDAEADLIVMGTVGRRGPRKVLLGSVTERVIEQSPVPVLVVK